MTIEGIRTAFEPAALQAIVEADVNKNSKSPDAQSLYQRLVTVTQKAVKALNLVDSGLKKTSNIRDDIDDLFE